MKVFHKLVLTLAPAALFCGVAAGQESAGDRPAPAMSQTELKPGDVRASNLLGAMVKRLSGDSIGEVEDLIVSAEADVRLAVISVGGILGLGAKTIAIPFDQFTVAPDGSTIYLTISEEELRARPAFELDGPDADLHLTPEPQAGRDGQTSIQPDDAPAATSSAQPLAAQDTTARVGHSPIMRSKATKQPASALIGAEVIGSEHSAIGRISDLIVTAEPPEVQVVVELAGASAASARFVAVPLDELTLSRSDDGDPHRRIERVETSLTVSELDVLPQHQF